MNKDRNEVSRDNSQTGNKIYDSRTPRKPKRKPRKGGHQGKTQPSAAPRRPEPAVERSPDQASLNQPKSDKAEHSSGEASFDVIPSSQETVDPRQRKIRPLWLILPAGIAIALGLALWAMSYFVAPM